MKMGPGSPTEQFIRKMKKRSKMEAKMFKSKEELIEEVAMGEYEYDEGVEKGLDAAFKSFAERVEFYKKYRNSGLQNLSCEKNELYKIVCFKIKGHYSGYGAFSHHDINHYNNWLFDYCFGDVIE